MQQLAGEQTEAVRSAAAGEQKGMRSSCLVEELVTLAIVCVVPLLKNRIISNLIKREELLHSSLCSDVTQPQSTLGLLAHQFEYQPQGCYSIEILASHHQHLISFARQQ